VDTRVGILREEKESDFPTMGLETRMTILSDGNAIPLKNDFRISFQRTLRVPDDGRNYPLPPSLGMFPVRAAEHAGDMVPQQWCQPNSFLIPMYQREALWVGFGGARWPPIAIKVAAGTVNAISGRIDTKGLHAHPQDYVVYPNQLWLDGFNSGSGSIRQFVAMPLGLGYTVEGSISDREEHGGIQITVFESRVDTIPARKTAPGPVRLAAQAGSMGLGAGGQIKQKIYPDPYGIDTWKQDCPVSIFVHIVNSQQYRAITGNDPPSSPIDAEAYTSRGFPWFDLYEEGKADVTAPESLTTVRTVAERDRELGAKSSETSIDVSHTQVIRIRNHEPGH